jgi:UDP:flavonoid glycosyltransferase YjiC (YdhE family)
MKFRDNIHPAIRTARTYGVGDGVIYIAMNPSGFGHSSRGIGVAKELPHDQVIMASGGRPLQRIKDAGFNTVEVDPEIEFCGKNGEFSVMMTALKNMDLPARVIEQVFYEEELMRKLGVSVVVSDCRAASVLAAARLKLPCLFMTNQTDIDVFFKDNDTLGEAMLSGALMSLGHMVMGVSMRDVNEILIGDFPTEDAVCLPILSKLPEIKGIQERVGPITTFRAKDVVPIKRASDRPYWIVTLGGQDFRQPLFYASIEAAMGMPEVDFDIVGVTPEMLDKAKCAGLVAREDDFAYQDGVSCVQARPNLRLLKFVPNPQSYYAAANGVITQAGHSTMMELVTLGKQAILVPDQKQVEQESNSRRMVELGCATQITYGELSGNVLAANVRHHMEVSNYEAAAQRLAGLAVVHDGASRAAERVMTYVRRMTSY